MCFANIALPLTNSFIGEFLMFNGLFKYNTWMAAVALITIILAAVYTLWMVQKVFYGEVIEERNTIKVPFNTTLMLSVLVALVLFFGVYPQPLINLTNDTAAKFIVQTK